VTPEGFAVSGDGRFLADVTSQLDKPAQVRLWDLHARRQLAATANATADLTAAAVAFVGPDGQTLAMPLGNGIGLYARPSLRLVGRVGVRHGPVDRLASLPDGKLLAQSGVGEGLLVVDPGHHTRTPLHATDTLGVGDTLSVGGPHAATFVTKVAGGRLTVWDSGSRRPLRSVKATAADVVSATLSRDGRLLGAADTAGTVALVDLAAPATALPPRGGLLWAFALAPDQHTIATDRDDGAVSLWRPGAQPLTLPNDGRRANDLAFSHDGRMLAAAATDGTVTVWDVPSRHRIVRWRAHNPQVRPGATVFQVGARSVAFTRDDAALLSVGSDSRLVRYDLRSRRAEATDLGDDRFQTAVEGPDATSLLLVTQSGLLYRSDPHGHGLRPLRAAPRVASASWTDDWRVTAFTLPQSPTVVLWDPRRGVALRRVNVADPGRTLSQVLVLDGGRDLLALQADPDLLHTKVIWWDLEHSRRVLAFRLDAAVNRLQLLDQRVLVAQDATEVRLWDLDAASVTRRLCAQAGRELTGAEWAQYLPGRPRSPVCG
jgi:WD40 repeat protein